MTMYKPYVPEKDEPADLQDQGMLKKPVTEPRDDES